MAKQNLRSFLPSKFENLPFLLLLPVVFHSFKFHTYTLLSSHSLYLCKKPLSSITFSYVVPFTLTWILFYYLPSLSEVSFFHSFVSPRYIPWQSHWIFALSLGYIPFTLSPLNMTLLTYPYNFLSVFSPSSPCLLIFLTFLVSFLFLSHRLLLIFYLIHFTPFPHCKLFLSIYISSVSWFSNSLFYSWGISVISSRILSYSESSSLLPYSCISFTLHSMSSTWNICFPSLPFL